MAYYRCGPTATIGNRTSWGPVSTPTVDPKYDRPLSGNYDRIFNAFERTNAFEYIRSSFEGKEDEDRHMGRGDIVVNRKMSSSYERADCALAAQTPCSEDEEFYREKILYSQARQLFPLQEDLADWINKTIGISYLTGENFLDVLDNGAELCQLAGVIHDRARESLHQGLIVGPVPQIRGRCWQRAARRSFFSRDNTENFITFCRELGVHENLLFESDDLVLHNQPRQVILCLLEVARLATRYDVEPPGLVQLEKEIAAEERDSGLDSAMSGAACWQFRDVSPMPTDDKKHKMIEPPPSPTNEGDLSVVDNADAESTKSGGTVDSSDSDVPLKPTNELDKRVQLVTRLMERGCSCGAGKCSKLLKVKKVGEGRYNIAGRNVFIRLLKGRHMMVRVGGGWDTLEHFLSRHEPCQVRLVTQGRRAALLPVPLTPSPPASPPAHSPVPRAHTPPQDARRTSTPKPTNKQLRSSLTLPLREQHPRPRKQSAPSLSAASTPSTPTPRTVRTPPNEHRKSFPSTTTNVPKKSRSASLASVQSEKKSFCGTDKLNRAKKSSRSASVASTPSDSPSRAARSQSLAGSPADAFCGADKLNAYVKKSRSMSLATPVAMKKSPSAPGGRSPPASPAITQAAIEESIRLSLAASIVEHDTKKPFLHIKAKYRSPPPREVPPR